MNTEINRRHMLLGLAAASTAAAAGKVDAATASAENPKLISLSEELPAIAAAYHEAYAAQEKERKYWNGQVWAPDELTIPGTAFPWDDVQQPGEGELSVIGNYLWRVGDKYPRRIVVRSWLVDGQIRRTRKDLRKARKEGRLADGLALEDEINRLKKLERIADNYQREHREVSAKAKEEYGKFWPVTHARLDALEKHVAAIMNEPDLTMEGLVIKAQALAEWDRVGEREGMAKLAFRHGRDWHGQIAQSILRHAGGAA